MSCEAREERSMYREAAKNAKKRMSVYELKTPIIHPPHIFTKEATSAY